MSPQGKNIVAAMEMARDAIGIKGIDLEDDDKIIPEPSKLEDVNEKDGTFAQNGTSFVTLVDIDFTAYRRKIDNEEVRRNVTLPSWLNQEAEKANINVSKVLQEALMKKLEEMK